MGTKSAALAILIGISPLASNAEDGVNCKQQLDQVLSELHDLRKLIESRPVAAPAVEPQPERAAIDVGDAPLLGSKDAPLTVVEFTDYQCPFCERFFKETFPDLKKVYIDSGKVRFYVMDLPLTEIHKSALTAAQAAHCAGEQGQFWAMHDRMQANRDRLQIADLTGYAGELGMDEGIFRQCIESGKFRGAVEESARMAQAKGARGTPAFVVGKSTPTGVEGQLIIGAVPLGIFEKALREPMK
jgi:protein-disulfide isomerase